MEKNKEKFLVVILGVFMCLFLLEITLRITGYAHLNTVEKVNLDKKNQKGRVILCLGDSLTYGIGIPRYKTYPKQLEKLLQERFTTGLNIKVINKGCGGYNTAWVLKDLKSNLETTKPDIVTLLIGAQNFPNLWGFKSFLDKRTFKAKLIDVLYRIRLFKLIKFMFLDVKNKKMKSKYCRIDENLTFIIDNNGGLETEIAEYLYFQEGDSKKAIEWYKKALKKDPKNGFIYYRMGLNYWDLGKFHKAIKWFKKGVNVDPDNFANYRHLGHAYEGIGDFLKALKWYKKTIEVNPHDAESLRGVVEHSMNLNMYNEGIKFLKRYKKTNPLIKDLINILSEKKDFTKVIEEWIMLDLEEIIRICKNKGIKIIIQGYPHNTWERINKLLASISKKNKITFVDNLRTFNLLQKKGNQKENYFIPDEIHPNTKGHEIIAKNLYHKIIDEDWLKVN